MPDQIEEQSVNTEEVADPSLEQIDDNETELSEETQEVADPEPQRDLERDKSFAELRRAKEDAERKLAAEDQWAKDNWGHMGIATMDQYKQALADQKKRDEYAEKGLDYDEMKKAIKEEIDSHPQVLSAKEKTELLEVNTEIRNLKKDFPDVDISEVSSLGDLRSTLEKLPNWDEIQKKVARGYELKDAYELVNRNDIMSKRAAQLEQAARNKVNSKNHLKASPTGAAGEEITIPQETLDAYRKMFPKKSDAEFIADYKKRRQQQ